MLDAAAGTMGQESTPDERQLPARFRAEAARLRVLAQECRAAGVFLEDFGEEIGRVRALVHAGNSLEGLERLRELQVELLGRLLLHGPAQVPPAPIENPPAAAPLSREEVAAVNARIERRLAGGPIILPRPILHGSPDGP